MERAGLGDLSRRHSLTETRIAGESTIFHAINRNKRSVEVDMKSRTDRAAIRRLISGADVVLQNHRPGVLDRLDPGYAATREINARIVCGSATGYGTEGPWVDLPGQDRICWRRRGPG